VKKGRLLSAFILVATVALITVGTLWPVETASRLAGSAPHVIRISSSPQAAVENLADNIARRDWDTAYASLANKSDFTEPDFIRDLSGSYDSLRTYASLASYDVHPAHVSPEAADMRLNLHWSTVVGPFVDTRALRVTRTGSGWQVVWPIVRESRVPPQVIPVNYLRWDVIYRGPGDDWGAQDVEAPHVRIVDMHPVDRGGGVVVLGELLNEDVVPAFVSVKATLLNKNGSAIETEDSFDKISHILLPKQVTPFLIAFKGVPLSRVDAIRMTPTASLIAAAADPVIEIEDQRMNPLPDAALVGKLLNQSGQVVNVAHVLGTFYDSTGQIVWVADHYVDRALLPQTPVPFSIPVPADLVGKVSSERVVTSTYSPDRIR